MRTKTKLAAVATALAAVAAAPAAHAADSGLGNPPPVPAGTIAEQAVQVDLHNSQGDSHTIVKTDQTNDKSHTLVTQPDGTTVVRELSTTPKIAKVFDAAANTLTLMDGYKPEPSAAAAYYYVQQGVKKGCYTSAPGANGLTTYTLVAKTGCADSPKDQETILANDAHQLIVQRTNTIQGEDFKQVESLLYTNSFDLKTSAAKLKMSPHPGAKVIDER